MGTWILTGEMRWLGWGEAKGGAVAARIGEGGQKKTEKNTGRTYIG
jgi:hypothetical protein